MKKPNHFFYFISILFMSVNLNVQAQELTLEELLPGGKNYFDFIPNLPLQSRWFGDQVAVSNKDTLYLVNPKSPSKKTLLITNEELRKLLSNERADVNRITFLKTGGTEAASILLPEKNSTRRVLFDIRNKQILKQINQERTWGNLDFFPDNQRIAFTIENNLYLSDENNGLPVEVAKDPDKNSINGQSVHRNEFGIKKGTFWSANGNYLAFYRMDESMVGDYPLVDISAREAELKSIKYPMAGMASHEVTVGVYNLSSGRTVFLKTGDPKNRYFTNLSWSPDEKYLYIAELNRNQDTCTVNCYDIQTGAKERTLFTETNEKYVEPQNPMFFLKRNPELFIWQSKRDGYNQLYLYRTDGELIRKLTSARADVLQILGFDEKEQFIFITSNELSPIETQVYKINIETGERIQLTFEPGVHSAVLSPSGKYLLDNHSSQQTILNQQIIRTENKQSIAFQKASDPYSSYRLPEVSLGSLKAADGASDLYYRLVKPLDFDSTQKYPVIIYVYGGPHSQMVKNNWMAGMRGWDIYMAQKGYVVFTMDNRGTSNRGLAFENVIHRNLGVHETADQMCGVEFLKSLPYVDVTRIGVHGWSYGGFMATNMILRHPDVFKVAVSGGPVIDWKYYEVMYGERYMDTPQENKQGYENVSLLNLAGNLKGHLLLIHGDEDPTVVWQNSLSFLKACIKARTYPDYFIYPGHGHNMSGPDRVHLYEKITRYFDDYLK
ncbi:MAG: S9 family peptidase [Dysgonamonadaceae bacterium]|jgi:dipeptidyl-peptidase-4|nr:S9 family peptidase [Dysgonamonadaceae bacterium]